MKCSEFVKLINFEPIYENNLIVGYRRDIYKLLNNYITNIDKLIIREKEKINKLKEKLQPYYDRCENIPLVDIFTHIPLFDEEKKYFTNLSLTNFNVKKYTIRKDNVERFFNLFCVYSGEVVELDCDFSEKTINSIYFSGEYSTFDEFSEDYPNPKLISSLNNFWLQS